MFPLHLIFKVGWSICRLIHKAACNYMELESSNNAIDLIPLFAWVGYYFSWLRGNGLHGYNASWQTLCFLNFKV